MSMEIDGWVLVDVEDPIPQGAHFPDTFNWAPQCTRCGARIEERFMALHDKFHASLENADPRQSVNVVFLQRDGTRVVIEGHKETS